MSKVDLLKNEKEFEAFRQSKSFQSPALRIRVLSKINQDNPRFGFIIPKKVLPKVVDRNVVKRRIKTVLSRIVGKLKPVDVLMFPSKAILKKKFVDIEKEINNLFSSAKLWK